MSVEEREGERSALERALGIVTEVKAGEGLTALLMTLNIFLLLTAYYVIKPVREGLILAMEGGAEKKSYLGAVIAVALLFAVPAYARVADRLPKNKLVVGVTLFFASHLVVFWVLSKIPSAEKNLGLVFFVWVGIFNMMVVAQFWAFANDLYNQEQGKRLFALLGLGASLGAALGALVAGLLTDRLKVGVYELMLVAAAAIAGCAGLSQVAHARERRSKAAAQEDMPAPMSRQAKPAKRESAKAGAFALVFQHRYLTLIAVFSLLFTVVNTNGEYMLGVLVKAAKEAEAIAAGAEGKEAIRAASKEAIAGFYGDFFLWVNVLGVALQTFAVSRIVKFGGIRIAFFVLPLLALADASAIAVIPSLMVLRYGKILENATDYSLNNTVRNMLWLPTTTEMKYKAKQAVDTFFVRMGDVASAGVVFAVATVAGDLAPGGIARVFAVTNVVLVAAWIFVARGIVRENERLSAEKPKEREDQAAAS